MSQAQLSRLVHYSKGYLSKVEGGSKPPTADLARRCDDALGADGRLVALAPPLPARRRHDRPGATRSTVRPAQLPGAVPGFVGRQPVLDRLDAILAADTAFTDPGPAVVAITGTGGVGKTALAVRWAHHVRQEFPDGILFADLRGYGPTPPVPPTEIAEGFLRALGVAPESIPPDEAGRIAILRTTMDGRRLLMILDNAVDPTQVRPLVLGSAGCLVLVTSRSRLAGLVARDGAVRLELAPLPEPDAIDLLRVTVGRERVGAQPAAAAGVARYCGYLPLALRIVGERAAARQWLSLGALVDQLRVERDRLDLLAADDDTSTAVRSVLSWSYQELPAETARALRLLALHPGPDISAAAAGALFGVDSAGTRRVLDALCGAHLLEEHHAERYRQHDLLRLYARERADADEPHASRTAARRRLLTWYLHAVDAAAQMLVPQRHAAALEPPPPDCRPLGFAGYSEALAWCTAERANLVASVGSAADAGEDATAWRLANALAAFYLVTKHWHDWIATHRIGLGCARRSGDHDGEAQMLGALGIALGDIGRNGEAVDCLEQALAIRQAGGDRANTARTMLNLGVAYSNCGRIEPSMQCFSKALDIFREIGEAYGQGIAMNNLGDAHLLLGRLGDARAYLDQALAVFRAGGNRFGEGMVLNNLGVTFHGLGRFDQAESYLRQALVIRRETGNRHGEAVSLRRLGELLFEADRPDEARDCLMRALAVFDELDAPQAGEVRQQLAVSVSAPQAANTAG